MLSSIYSLDVVLSVRFACMFLAFEPSVIHIHSLPFIFTCFVLGRNERLPEAHHSHG